MLHPVGSDHPAFGFPILQDAEGYALTDIQRGMLADSLVAESKGVNVEQVVHEVDEWLDPETLRTAWQRVLDDFDALRLQFELKGGRNPVQRSACSAVLPFKFVDWSGHDATSVTQELDEILAEDRRLGFDLLSVPLLRVAVFRVPDSRTVVLWTVHHTIIDGASYPIVLDRVLSNIEQLRAGGQLSPTKAVPYLGLLKWLSHQDSRPGIAFFQDLLRGFTEPTPLPLAGMGHRQAETHAGDVRRRLSAELTSDLLGAAVEAQVSPNTIVQLAWGLLLGRFTGRDDVVFGVTWSGRPNTIDDAEQVVGPFINTLPVRVEVAGGPSVRGALKALREQHVSSRPFHQTPLSRIKDASEMPHAKAVYRTIVVFEKQRPLAKLQQDGIGVVRRRFWSRSQTGYPLSLAAYLEDGSLVFELEFDTKLYDIGQANELLDSLTCLVGAMPGALDQCVHDIPILAPAVHHSMTVQEAAREVAPDRPRVIEQIVAQTNRRPESPAVCDMQGRSISYGQLKGRVTRAARVLRQKGVRDGAIVAILIPRSIDAIVAQLAVHLAGAAFLMLDQSFPEARLRFKLEDSGSQWLIVNNETANFLHYPGAQRLSIETLASPVEGEPEEAFSAQHTEGFAGAAGNELSYLIYTSGSTGQPKGVRIGAASLANHVAVTIELFELRDTDRVLQFSAQSFDVSLEEIFSTLAAGATLVLRDDKMAISPREFLDAIAAARISVVNLPTAFWHQIVQLSDVQSWPGCVRLVIVGGERASPRVLEQFRASGNEHIRWLNLYGPTEATIASTAYDDRARDNNADCLPIGRSLAGHSHFLLDKKLRPVPPGATGQLYIGGVGVALGYHKRDALTRERFIPHPWRTGARLYATGDLVRTTRRGNYEYVDRADNQVKVRGFRIELGEIEIFLRRHPKVREAAVIVHQHAGEVAMLVGYVESESKVAPLAIREYLSAVLPHYMVPAHIMVDTHLPRTSAGKIDRQALLARDLSPALGDGQTDLHASPLEGTLLEIWSELLGVPVHDMLADFFELGGNSLLVMNLFAAIEKRLKKTPSAVEFLRIPTLKHLAEMIGNEPGSVARPPLLRLTAGRPGVRPLFLAPGATGRGVDFAHLARAFDRSIPIYAIEIRGLAGGEAPHRDLAEASRDYVKWMQEVQPMGPYALAGFSAGCIAACVMARVLIERGESVDFMGMIDGIPPPTNPHPTPFSNPRRLASLVRTAVGRTLQALANTNPMHTLWSRGRLAVRRMLKHWFWGASDQHVTIDEVLGGHNVEIAREEKQVMQAHLSMLMQCKLQPVPIEVVLFRTSLNPIAGPYEADLGWRRLITGNIVIEILPGRHEDLIAESGAPALGDRMNQYLVRRTH